MVSNFVDCVAEGVLTGNLWKAFRGQFTNVFENIFHGHAREFFTDELEDPVFKLSEVKLLASFTFCRVIEIEVQEVNAM